MNDLLSVNQFLWSGPLLFLLMGLHIYHTVSLHFVQHRITEALRLSVTSESAGHTHGFSLFGSLTTTLAATLGTGNIVGVSTAVYLGGPGAVFWCWLTGVLGMATTYAESYLCSHFRFTDKKGLPQSGPMYILYYILDKKYLAILYSIALCLSSFFIGCITQSNAITLNCSQIF